MFVFGNGIGFCMRKFLVWFLFEEFLVILKRIIIRKVRKIVVSTELREEFEFIYKCGLFIYKCGFSRLICLYCFKFFLFLV